MFLKRHKDFSAFELERERCYLDSSSSSPREILAVTSTFLS